MSIENIRIVYMSLADDINLSLNSGAVQSGWGLDNLQSDYLFDALKSGGSGNLSFRGTLSRTRWVTCFCFAGFNLHADTVVTFRSYETGFSQVLYEEAFQAVGPWIEWGELPWGEFPLDGLPDDDDLAAYPRITALYPLAQDLQVSDFEIEIANGEGCGQ